MCEYEDRDLHKPGDQLPWDTLAAVAHRTAMEVGLAHAAAMDVSRDTMAAVLVRMRAKWGKPENVRAWVWVVAERLAVSKLDPLDRDGIAVKLEDGLAGEEENADEAGAVIAGVIIDEILALLSPDQKLAFRLRMAYNLDRMSIAEIMDVPVETITRLLDEARAKISEPLRDIMQEDDDQ